MYTGLDVVKAEANAVVDLLRKAQRRYGNAMIHHPSVLDGQDPLLRSFSDLKEVLINVRDLGDMNPATYLDPFLDVIKAEQTNGPVTAQAISSIVKFIRRNLIDDSSIKAASAVESICQSVTRAKFMGGSDAGSDEDVLRKILECLKELLISSYGRLLSDEDVCEMIQSCFKIAFESTLSEMLRKIAEDTLRDMTEVIFSRLPTFQEDVRHLYPKMLHAKSKKKRKHHERPNLVRPKVEKFDQDLESECPVAEEAITETEALMKSQNAEDSISGQNDLKKEVDAGEMPDVEVEDSSQGSSDVEIEKHNADVINEKLACKKTMSGYESSESESPQVIDIMDNVDDGIYHKKNPSNSVNVPYGLPCASELLRFLITICNPANRDNTDSMVILALKLLIVGLEAGADSFSKYSARLLPMVQNELCRALLLNLDKDKSEIIRATNRVCFLLFEALRTYLKLQLEMYFHKLRTIVTGELKTTFEQKEKALESIADLWRIPGLVTELYLNYDCDFYCSNLFEDLTKLLHEHAYPVSGLHSTNVLSLDALLTVIDTIDSNSIQRRSGNEVSVINEAPNTLPLNYSQVRPNRMAPSKDLPTKGHIIYQKKQKGLISEGTALFNKSPKKGIGYLMEKGVLPTPLSATDVAHWLRSNPGLDKKGIAEYICSRERKEIFRAFVGSFNFAGSRIDDCLRMFLEAFRLPGEAPDILMTMELFSEFWHLANNEPFNHVDGAFTLSYAIIMLNTDQHNPTVGKNQQRMSVECFKRNLSGTNGGQDFDPAMLDQIYHAIKTNEIVMPAEHTGVLKENYEWKVLMKRMETSEGKFSHAPAGWNDQDLFGIVWGPTAAALSYVFDKSDQETIWNKSLNGYRKCASIAAHYALSDVFDNLIISLSKYSTLLTSPGQGKDGVGETTRTLTIKGSIVPETAENIAIVFGENGKAQMATRTMFQLVHSHGDILGEGWRNVLDCFVYLFRNELLPKSLTQVEDFVHSSGFISIQRKKVKDKKASDSGLLSWFGLGGNSYEETFNHKNNEQFKKLIDTAKQVIVDCHPEQLITDGKYLRSSALHELLNNIIIVSCKIYDEAESEKSGKVAREQKKLHYKDEDSIILLFEIMISVMLENKDRPAEYWPLLSRHIEWILNKLARNSLIVERAVIGLIRIANRNLYRLQEDTANKVLASFEMLLHLRPTAFFLFSKQISYGLFELLRNNAANVHLKQHWEILFALLEATGAANYPELENNPGQVGHIAREIVSDTEHLKSREIPAERGYTSDIGQDYKKCGEYSFDNTVNQTKETATIRSVSKFDQGSIILAVGLAKHDPLAFLKVGETLSFLARDGVHVTPENFDSCIKCLRSMIEAGMNGGINAVGPLFLTTQNERSGSKEETTYGSSESLSGFTNVDTEKQNQISEAYNYTAHQLLELCYSLHVKAYGIFNSWSKSDENVPSSISHLWLCCWCPLLQAIARICCDCRRQVRTQALNTLVRAFLIPELGKMSSDEWESCFGDVLFPLLTKLLNNIFPMDPIGMEETRVRAIQLVCKILLNHLTSLQTLQSFPILWVKLLGFMKLYLQTERSDLLAEAVPESLKNMILVLDNTGLFDIHTGLYEVTKTNIEAFLPTLASEIMTKDGKQTMSVAQNEIPNCEVIHEQTRQPTPPLTGIIIHSGPSSPLATSPVNFPPPPVYIPSTSGDNNKIGGATTTHTITEDVPTEYTPKYSNV
uniref:SEC7 domain-containing protein n=1 Tax=Rhabditophanes sp. KR3021 TaxID=114890 RepID=A0AC35TM01_9BILA